MVAVYAMLGTKCNSLRGNTGAHAVELYMVQPATKLHKKDILRCNRCLQRRAISRLVFADLLYYQSGSITNSAGTMV